MADESGFDEAIGPGGIPSEERFGTPRLSAEVNAAAKNAASERSREARAQWRATQVALFAAVGALAAAAAIIFGSPGVAAIGVLASGAFAASRIVVDVVERLLVSTVVRVVADMPLNASKRPLGLADLGARLAAHRAALERLAVAERGAEQHD